MRQEWRKRVEVIKRKGDTGNRNEGRGNEGRG